MALTVTVAPTATDLTELATVKAELEITVATHDTVLSLLIKMASEAINRALDRGRNGLASQTYQETLGGFGEPFLILARTPITSVTSVTIDGVALTGVSIHDAEAGILYRESGFDSTEPMRREIELIHEGLPALPKITATYVAGWITPGTPGGATRTLPYDLEKAAIETVKAWFLDRKRDPRLASQKLGGDRSESYFDSKAGAVHALPPLARALIAPYQRVAVA